MNPKPTAFQSLVCDEFATTPALIRGIRDWFDSFDDQAEVTTAPRDFRTSFGPEQIIGLVRTGVLLAASERHPRANVMPYENLNDHLLRWVVATLEKEND